MARTIVVKLLGRRIGFNVVLNRISLLWNLRHPIQMIDLENAFFMVRFQDEDYSQALVGRPWVIYDHYLTVRPWSSEFSTNQIEVEHQVVWIRLPSLPQGNYSDCLL
ncbi:hypothetical protein PVK06_025087 [Gossypium arboreum]|uniref:DUF4283 domain-containing protein n=1 Tax=Gossypium arboreum TaxID=29729 RepID=A0ABR0PFS3_GOSAR|nr:hypothetical protein PVK06_025087 [Gossypium arboreum]